MSDIDDDSSPPRLAGSAPEFGRKLARSASLDAAPEGLRDWILERLETAAVPAPHRLPRRSALFFTGAAGVLAGAVLILVLRPDRGPAPPEVSREAPGVTPRAARGAASTAPTSSVVANPSASSLPAPPPCPRVSVASGGAPLIDDMEDQNARLTLEDGRSGAWGAWSVPKAKVTPPGGGPAFPVLIPGGRDQSRYALHAFGGRQSQHFSLLAEFSPRRCYDASAYAGIEFWAKARGRIYLGITMIDVMETRWGGLCTANCYDQHRKGIDLAGQWQKISVPWQDLEQTGFGTAIAFDPKRILSFEFGVDAVDTPFDYWIDDVSFISR